MLRKADDWAVVVQNYRQSAGICAGKSYGRASEAVMDKSSKIAGKCAGKRPGKAREVALAKPNIWTVSMANVFNAKIHERWCTLARVNVEKLNNENRYCIPLCMGTNTKNLFHEGSHVLGDFFKKTDLGNGRAIAKKRFFDCRNLGRRLARISRIWHNPSNKWQGGSGARALLAETRKNLAQPN